MIRQWVVLCGFVLAFVAPPVRAEAPPDYLLSWGAQGSGPGEFNGPFGIACDAAGFVYVVDESNIRVQKFDANGVFVRQWPSNPPFCNAEDIEVGPDGRVYVLEMGCNAGMNVYSCDGDLLDSWPYGPSDFTHAFGIDKDGNIYIADTAAHAIFKYSKDGTPLGQWGGPGSGDGQFNRPWDVAINGQGDVFVSDLLLHRIQKFTTDGVFVSKWGTQGSGDNDLLAPRGLDVDLEGNLYVSDTGNLRIKKYAPDGTLLALWMNPDCDGPNVNAGSLDVAVDRHGFVFTVGGECINKFGFPLATPDPCLPPPLGLVAWWPLDEPAGPTAQDVVYGNDGSYFTATNAPGKVAGAVDFDGSIDNVRVLDDAHLNFPDGNFSIDAWILSADSTTTRAIVDKTDPSAPNGYSMFLREGRLGLTLSAGATEEFWSGPSFPNLADGAWHQVAAAVYGRCSVTLYADGQRLATFPITLPAGSIANTLDLHIGAAQAPGGGLHSFFNGKIDEVEIFDRALSGYDLQLLLAADVQGKCKEHGHLPWDVSVCEDDELTKVVLSICNDGTTASTYDAVFLPMPAGSGGAGGYCDVDGPTGFQVVGTLPVQVEPGKCASIPVQIARPPGLGAGLVSCYRAVVTNQSTGRSFECRGSLEGESDVCVDPKIGKIYLGKLDSTIVRFLVTNTGTTDETIDYSLAAVSSDMDRSNLVVELDGLAPGREVEGSVFVGPGQTSEVSVQARMMDFQPFRTHEVLFKHDFRYAGTKEAVSATGILPIPRTGLVSAEPPHGVDLSARVSSAPNPFASSTSIQLVLGVADDVRVDVFGLTGRRIRTLHSGRLAAGPHSFTWDGRASDGTIVASGVYVVRALVGTRTLASKLVRLGAGIDRGAARPSQPAR